MYSLEKLVILTKVKAIRSARIISAYLDYILWLIFDMAKYKSIEPSKIKKVLIVMVKIGSPNLGGDFCFIGAINYLKNKYKDIKFTIISDNKSIQNYGKLKGVEIIEYENKKTISWIKEQKFDAVLFESTYIIRPKDVPFIPYRISMGATSPAGLFNFSEKLGSTRRTFIAPEKEHMVESVYNLFRQIGLFSKEKKLVFESSKIEEEKVNSFIKKNKIGKFIVIHPSGKHVAEEFAKGKIAPHLWPIDRYVKVAKYFVDKGYSVIVTGTKNENLIAQEIAKKVKIVNCCGMFSFRESGVLLKKAKLLIATDTSIVHIAYQIGTPIVEVMGPTLPRVHGAWPNSSTKHEILFDDGPLAGSMRKKESLGRVIALGKIKASDVIEASEKLLSVN